MFNLKKAQAQFVSSFQPTITVEMIHREFDTAVDLLLSKALDIDEFKKDRHDRLKKLGFNNIKEVKEMSAQMAESNKQRTISEYVNKYAINYPNNKFITKELVESICKKYGLAKATVGYFIGEIPDKNLEEIEAFVLNENDCIKYPISKLHISSATEYYGYAHDNSYYITTEKEGYKIHKESLEICAPIKDFDTTHLKLEGTNLVPKDPIVLQPLAGGYIIVSKWGAEGEDKDLINEKMN